MFQLILNPTRDWNEKIKQYNDSQPEFQLILNPTRDWNLSVATKTLLESCSN